MAVERDRDICPILREAFADAVTEGKLEIVEADAKKIDIVGLLASGPAPRVVAGNLPYQLTGPLLERTTAVARDIDRAGFMVQSEAAHRPPPSPGSEAYGPPTVSGSAASDVAPARP